MDRELMEKEVLCIFDTRQIQRYMFRTNSYFDTVGASDIMIHILKDAISFALKNIDQPLEDDEYDLSLVPDKEAVTYFKNPKIKFQIILCSAGNAMCIVRTGALCQKIIRKISRYYLDHGYSLNLAAAAVEKTNHLGNDVFNLYKKLNAVKASGEISNPLGALDVVIRESRTGDPVTGVDPVLGDYISKASQLRRREAKLRDHVYNIGDIRTTAGHDGQQYRAVIHADGNNLGITIGGILQTTPDYINGIVTRRQINQNITVCFREVMKDTTASLRQYYTANGGKDKDFDFDFQVVHQAGDDINIICNADMAFPFVDCFYRNLEGRTIWDMPGKRVPVYVCMGIAFVTPEYDFHAGFTVAEECCKSAKTYAKKEENLRDGLAGNWIDFQLCSSQYVQELEMLRENKYITGNNINLLLRPYCLDEAEKNGARSYGAFRKRMYNFEELSLNAAQEEFLRLSYSVGREVFEQWLIRPEVRKLGLRKKLGDPLYYVKNENPRAVWFDAMEAADFIKKYEVERSWLY